MNALNFVGFLFFPAAVLNLFELLNYFWVQDYKPQFISFSIPLFAATALWYVYNVQKVDWFKYKFYKISFFDRNYYVIALPFLMPWVFLVFDMIYIIPVFILALLINDYCLRKYFLKKISMIPVVKAAMDIEDFDEENVDIKGYYKNFFIRTFWAYPILFFLSGTESIITRSLAIIVLLSVIFVEIYFQKVRKKGVMKILENPKPESLKEAKNPVELDKNELKIKNFYNYFFSIGLIFIVSGAVQVRKNFEEEIENTIKTAHENERFSVKVKSSVKNDEIDNKDFYDCFREVVRNNEDFEDMLSITVLLDKRKCNKGKEDYYDDTFKNCVIKKFRYLCFESVPSGTSEIKFNMEFKYSAK